MELSELFSTSFEALSLNKTRTALSVLGIVIGIASVIALMALGQGSQKAISDQIEALGSNLLTVMPGAQVTRGIQSRMGSGTTLTYDDAKALASSSQTTAVEAVSAELVSSAQVVAGRANTNTTITGVMPAYAQIKKMEMGSGVFISKRDLDSQTKVAVLGPQTVSDLFGEGLPAGRQGADPIGESIRINNINFKIVGVTESKGGGGFFNQDDVVFIPLTTAQKQVFGQEHVNTISIAAKSEELMEQARNEVGYLLLTLHKLSDPEQADFSIMSQEDIIGAMTEVTSTFTALLSGIAAISLLVGGIGIMNIMLVTVVERTREIGLRKALGAKRKDIISQFLVESVILTGVGGLLGVVLGTLISLVLVKMMSIPWTFSLNSYLLATSVSAVIGIVFGFYPAYKASNLSPIEALRYE